MWDIGELNPHHFSEKLIMAGKREPTRCTHAPEGEEPFDGREDDDDEVVGHGEQDLSMRVCV